MLYHLFHYLDKIFDIPGGRLFNFISFRTGLAFILALLLSTMFGRRIIDYLQKKQIGETIRDLGLEGQMSKRVRQLWVESSLLLLFWCQPYCWLM